MRDCASYLHWGIWDNPKSQFLIKRYGWAGIFWLPVSSLIASQELRFANSIAYLTSEEAIPFPAIQGRTMSKWITITLSSVKDFPQVTVLYSVGCTLSTIMLPAMLPSSSYTYNAPAHNASSASFFVGYIPFLNTVNAPCSFSYAKCIGNRRGFHNVCKAEFTPVAGKTPFDWYR